MLYFDSSHPIVTRGSHVSCTPPHQTLPAFLNLNGISLYERIPKVINSMKLYLNKYKKKKAVNNKLFIMNYSFIDKLKNTFTSRVKI